LSSNREAKVPFVWKKKSNVKYSTLDLDAYSNKSCELYTPRSRHQNAFKMIALDSFVIELGYINIICC